MRTATLTKTVTAGVTYKPGELFEVIGVRPDGLISLKHLSTGAEVVVSADHAVGAD